MTPILTLHYVSLVKLVRMVRKLGESKSIWTMSASLMMFWVTFSLTSALSSFKSSVRIGITFEIV